jgi:aconitase A
MDPKVLKYLNAAFRRTESIKLYREVLRTSKLFTWTDDKGTPFSTLIK